MTDASSNYRSAAILDDDARVGAIIAKMLDALHVESATFVEPLPFFVRLASSPPDLVILDLALGETDAIEIIRKLEIQRFRGHVLLISGKDHTALAEIEQIGRSHKLAMLPPLRKPFRIADLEERLKAPLQQFNASDQAPASLPNSTKINLAEALNNKWLELWYQPKVDLKTLKINSAEALIRAKHPTCGIVTPVDLLPPAGDPLYKPLTVFVLKQVISDWYRFADEGIRLALAINVPASVLNAPGFVDIVRQSVPDDADFPGIIIEVTEDEIIRDQVWIHEIATQLRLYNTTISIDDFGSGYANLSRLREILFKELKLDRSFVNGCGADALKNALCRTVLNIAHQFNASACAEGVETREDAVALKHMGFDTVQGYYFAKPAPREEFIRFLQSQPTWDLTGSPDVKNYG